MSLDILKPVTTTSLNNLELSPDQVLGKNIKIHSLESGLPDLEDVKIAIVGITENRNSFFQTSDYELSSFRNSFYKLFPGNWGFQIADLGNLPNGETVNDTYFALTEISKELQRLNIVSIFLGGSHDMIYPIYKSYSFNKTPVNIVSIDNQFDFSQDEELISGRSYMSRIIMEDPNFLQNYTNLGYQSFFIAQEELDLMNKLFFEAIRLGKILDDVSISEPYFRDANIVGVDMKSLSCIASGNTNYLNPNGIDSRTICSLARYAGISDRVTSFGLFELPSTNIFHNLLSQIIWYFIEGISCRFNEYPISIDDRFIKYIVTLSDRELVFYKSNLSKRWWLEIKNENYIDNKLKRSTLLPCTIEDYDSACDDKLPERWLKAYKRL
ncbi:MAG: arginase [Flavobacteriaceae bacterium]|nr:arginase [Flavobacteriaceae bacterium]